MARIDELSNIDVREATRLRKAGVRTSEALLRRAISRNGRDQLANACSVDQEAILAWAARADLLRVKGVGGEYAALLEAAGVATIRDLRRRNPKALTARLSEVNDRKRLVRRLPTEGMVSEWVDGAKVIEPVVR